MIDRRLYFIAVICILILMIALTFSCFITFAGAKAPNSFVIPIFPGEDLWFYEPSLDYTGKIAFNSYNIIGCRITIYVLDYNGWVQVEDSSIIPKGVTILEVIPTYPRMYCNPSQAKLDLSSQTKLYLERTFLPGMRKDRR